MRSVILAVLMFCSWSPGFAAEQCAIENGETYVSRPEGGNLPQRGPNSIRKGQKYEVGKIQDGWIAVNADGEFAWAKALIFAYSCQPTASGPGYVAKTPTPNKSQAYSSASTSKASKAPKNASSSYDAGGCPCSGSRVCVGPRGGRYCITSGGRKRYGV